MLLALLVSTGFVCCNGHSIKNPYFARIGLAWALWYLGVGYWWHQSERKTLENLAVSHGHSPECLVMNPTFGNSLFGKVFMKVKNSF